MQGFKYGSGSGLGQRFVVARSFVAGFMCLVPILLTYGCRPPSKDLVVSAQRDFDAVPFRLHNRTLTELLVKPFVRERLAGVPLEGVISLEANRSLEELGANSDAELIVFSSLPLKAENVGAYSLEISGIDSEARLGVIDIPRSEMEKAKEFGRATVVFRPVGMQLVIGDYSRAVPWLRELPRPKVKK